MTTTFAPTTSENLTLGQYQAILEKAMPGISKVDKNQSGGNQTLINKNYGNAILAAKALPVIPFTFIYQRPHYSNQFRVGGSALREKLAPFLALWADRLQRPILWFSAPSSIGSGESAFLIVGLERNAVLEVINQYSSWSPQAPNGSLLIKGCPNLSLIHKGNAIYWPYGKNEIGVNILEVQTPGGIVNVADAIKAWSQGCAIYSSDSLLDSFLQAALGLKNSGIGGIIYYAHSGSQYWSNLLPATAQKNVTPAVSSIVTPVIQTEAPTVTISASGSGTVTAGEVVQAVIQTAQPEVQPDTPSAAIPQIAYSSSGGGSTMATSVSQTKTTDLSEDQYLAEINKIMPGIAELPHDIDQGRVSTNFGMLNLEIATAAIKYKKGLPIGKAVILFSREYLNKPELWTDLKKLTSHSSRDRYMSDLAKPFLGRWADRFQRPIIWWAAQDVVNESIQNIDFGCVIPGISREEATPILRQYTKLSLIPSNQYVSNMWNPQVCGTQEYMNESCNPNDFPVEATSIPQGGGNACGRYFGIINANEFWINMASYCDQSGDTEADIANWLTLRLRRVIGYSSGQVLYYHISGDQYWPNVQVQSQEQSLQALLANGGSVISLGLGAAQTQAATQGIPTIINAVNQAQQSLGITPMQTISSSGGGQSPDVIAGNQGQSVPATGTATAPAPTPSQNQDLLSVISGAFSSLGNLLGGKNQAPSPTSGAATISQPGLSLNSNTMLLLGGGVIAIIIILLLKRR